MRFGGCSSVGDETTCIYYPDDDDDGAPIPISIVGGALIHLFEARRISQWSARIAARVAGASRTWLRILCENHQANEWIRAGRG
jgi:hypothetical protein